MPIRFSILLKLLPMLALGGFSASAEVLSLADAVNEAVRSNPDAALAQSRIAEARATLAQAESAFLPRVSVEASYALTNNPVSVFGSVLNQQAYSPSLNFNDVPDTDNFNLRGTVAYPLYAGGSRTAARDGADAMLEAARHGQAAVHQQLAAEAAAAYLAVWRARSLVEAAEAAVRAYEEHLGVIGEREKEGTSLRTDLLDMQVRLAYAREDLARARNGHELARHALRNLLGRETGEVEIAGGTPGIPAPGEVSPQRAELRAAAATEKAAEAAIREIKAGKKPRVDLFGSVEENYGTRHDSGAANYTVGVRLKWDLWDGGEKQSRAAAAIARAEAARQRSRMLRLSIDLEIKQARLGLKEANERLAVSSQAVGQAEESVKLVTRRYAEGLALATQLIDAETALTVARVHRSEAEVDRLRAIVMLRKALGLPVL
ncbi:TolC family protein [Haloferula sargassicola]|uniref:Outer membrane protein TolC n=1 Tax=Haloferula sargassicola TaxID=490096 RepID=A0ABP9UKE1_9BACT